MKYFIPNISYIKDNTTLNGNINDQDIQPLIKITSEMLLLNLLGDDVYTSLLTKYNSNVVLTPSELELLSKIQPVMSWGVCYEATLYVSATTSAKGASKLSGENSEPIDFAEKGHLRKTLIQKRDFYLNNLIQYVCKNNINHTSCGCQSKKSSIGLFFV